MAIRDRALMENSVNSFPVAPRILIDSAMTLCAYYSIYVWQSPYSLLSSVSGRVTRLGQMEKYHRCKTDESGRSNEKFT